jgi:TatD DNase family protein
MNFVDTHTHLTHKLFKDDVDAVIQRAKDVGVKAMLVSGVNPPSNRDVLELCRKYSDICKASLGLYPIDALGLGPDESGMAVHAGPIDVDDEFSFFKKHKDEIAAIGEVGLDYKYNVDHMAKQKEIFERVISWTEKLGKPIVVHTRKAEEDCISMLESSRLKNVILHTFEGNKKLVKRAADAGFLFSVPTLLPKSSHFQMIVDTVDFSHLLTETDAPWLGVDPDKRNEPAFVLASVKKMAEIKGVSVEDAAAHIWKNYSTIFK